MRARDVRMADYGLDRAQLIDDFRRMKTPGEKSTLVSQTPPLPALSQYHHAHLAATVEALCLEAGIEPPHWVMVNAACMPEPVYPAFLKDFKPMTDYIDANPNEIFLRHNILIDDDILRRA